MCAGSIPVSVRPEMMLERVVTMDTHGYLWCTRPTWNFGNT